MSKYVKQLVMRDIANRLVGVSDAVLVTTTGMDANTTNQLRGELEEKNIHVMVVKNSLCRRAFEGSALAAAFEGATGQTAVCWGSSDFVALAKEVIRLDKDGGKYEKFKATGGVLDGEPLSAQQLAAVSKWPTREEQISILVGQILAREQTWLVRCSVLVGPWPARSKRRAKRKTPRSSDPSPFPESKDFLGSRRRVPEAQRRPAGCCGVDHPSRAGIADPPLLTNPITLCP